MTVSAIPTHSQVRIVDAGLGRPSPRLIALAVAVLASWAIWFMVAPSALAATGQVDGEKLTGPAAQSLPLADTLAQGGRGDEAQLLRRYLLHRHVDELLGLQATAPVTVRDAINKAAFDLGNPVTDKALAARWQQAFNRHVSVRPNAGGYLPAPWRALNPAPQEVATGAWLAVQPEGTRHLVTVFLFNASPTALPFMPLSLELGGLAFACRPGPDNNPDTGEPVMPKNDRLLICEATAAPGSKKPGVRALATSAPQPPAWLWRPAHLESDASVQALLAAIGLQAQEQLRAEAQQRAIAQQRVRAELLARPPPLTPAPHPTTSPTPSRGLKVVSPLALVCVVIVVLAYLGKALRSWGWSDGDTNSATVVLTVLVSLPLVAMESNPGGLGGLLIFLVMGGVVIGGAVIVGLMASALRKVLELLDKAGLSFQGAVADALRRSLDFTGTASPAQFWSVFLLYWVLAAVTLAMQPSVALWVVLAVLGLPMTALTVRRVRAMPWIEVLILCAVVVYIAADIFVL
jgi:hypothetical protein